jgi:transposase
MGICRTIGGVAEKTKRLEVGFGNRQKNRRYERLCRTFAWLGNYRLLAKEYEYSFESSESDIYIAMIQLMLKRLTC